MAARAETRAASPTPSPPGAWPLTVGTAGHIDHGKTALVAALTGKQTDRLPEERERGISIELGYAPLDLPGGRRVSMVDVPGHERFVRTMVAGASGIDMFLLCVAADDGVMPQTREHAAVLGQLGVTEGVVAITKADVGEPQLAGEEAGELVPKAEVVVVSALRRTGLDELLAALARVAERLPGRRARAGPARLHVDRSFTLRGIGTVVTGTLWAGELGVGDTVEVLPRGARARVRSVQVHDHPVERAAAGQRVALNLVGLDWRELGRGDVVTVPAAGLAPTHLVDALVSLEPGARPLRRGARLHVHHGTREAPARVYGLESDRVRSGGERLVQLRLEEAVVPVAGDRLVLRQLAPPDTVGGGRVLDAHPRRHGGGEAVLRRLRALVRGEAPPTEPPPSRPAAPASDPEPLSEPALRLAALLEADGRQPRADGDLAAAAGLTSAEVGRRLAELVGAGRAVRVGRNLHFHPAALAELERRVVALCERDGAATIAGVRDELATTRRYAQAVLEHLDATRVTLRRGDHHVLRRRAR